MLRFIHLKRSKEVRNLIQTAGCQLIYLAPYSPDLKPIANPIAKPIEKFWAWLKLKVRETAHLFTPLQQAVDNAFSLKL